MVTGRLERITHRNPGNVQSIPIKGVPFEGTWCADRKPPSRRTIANETDPRSHPAYPLSEAARYLKLPPATQRSWALGRPYPTTRGPGHFRPIIRPASTRPPLFSFWNLVEAHVLRALRTDHGFSVANVRRAIEFVSSMPADGELSSMPIAIDPRISFGRPVVISRGISTAAIAERIDAGETVEALAADYELTVDEIEQAVLYERAA
jgi:uncharacterized protein (DUF433 family)